MPNYNYKCRDCSEVTTLELRMSTDPALEFPCPKCGNGKMFRSVILCRPPNGLKVFAGDWFKKTYGHEIGEDGETAAEKKAGMEAALRQHAAENGQCLP
jgi:putative FmdB family regulatory protein